MSIVNIFKYWYVKIILYLYIHIYHHYIHYIIDIIYVYNWIPSFGMLFKYLMWTSSKYSGYRRCIRLVTLHERNYNDVLADVLLDELIQCYPSMFMGWFLFRIGSLGLYVWRQMFYIIFTMNYFGLYWQGIDILATYGYGIILDMFDKMYNDTKLKSIINIKYVYIYIYMHICIHVVIISFVVTYIYCQYYVVIIYQDSD